MATKKGVKKNSTPKKYCPKCEKEKPILKFYKSTSSLFPDGICSICSDCFVEDIDVENLESVKDGLMKLDLPFYHDKWDATYEKKGEGAFRDYVRQINSLPQYKNKNWKDSKFGDNSTYLSTVSTNSSSIQISDEILARWGNHSKKEDYQKLEQFYWDMKSRNKIETPQEEVYLKKLALISIKMDSELEQGNYDEAKKLGDLFSKYMADSQFRAIDKTEADKTGGIKNFGQIWEWAESEDFIPPWEYYRKLKNIKQDLVDKTIMHIENFTLKLNKIETMSEPPSDTPKISDDEIYTKED